MDPPLTEFDPAAVEAHVRAYLAGNNRILAIGECRTRLNCDFGRRPGNRTCHGTVTAPERGILLFFEDDRVGGGRYLNLGGIDMPLALPKRCVERPLRV
jgi:hypothetical protein